MITLSEDEYGVKMREDEYAAGHRCKLPGDGRSGGLQQNAVTQALLTLEWDGITTPDLAALVSDYLCEVVSTQTIRNRLMKTLKGYAKPAPRRFGKVSIWHKVKK